MIPFDTNKSMRISFGVMAVALVLIAWLHLGVLVLTSLFGFFVLDKLRMGMSKKFAVIVYAIVIIVAGYLLVHLSRQAVTTLPEIAEQVIPKIVSYAEEKEIDLPFADYAGAKTVTVDAVKESFASIGQHVRNAVFGFAQLLIGLVLAASLYLSKQVGSDYEPETSPDTLYATVMRDTAVRFQFFYASFSRVIGAQIIISAINTMLTGGYLLLNNYPNKYRIVLLGITFLCGLLPIVGNLASNALIVGVSFLITPHMALVALIFLIIIHKLEYFLNSKIIGDRTKNPMWLMLIGLVVGERLMGVSGIILAPVVLHYVKVEASRRRFSVPGEANAPLGDS